MRIPVVRWNPLTDERVVVGYTDTMTDQALPDSEEGVTFYLDVKPTSFEDEMDPPINYNRFED